MCLWLRRETTRPRDHSTTLDVPLGRDPLRKIDYKLAFRRLHLTGQAALQSTLSTKGLSDDLVALASLSVTFGGRPSPLLFLEVSEFI